MTYEIDKYRDIHGIEKIIHLKPDFVWNDIKYLESFSYYIDFDKDGEEISILKICFLYELSDKKMEKLCIKFYEVNDLKINNIGG